MFISLVTLHPTCSAQAVAHGLLALRRDSAVRKLHFEVPDAFKLVHFDMCGSATAGPCWVFPFSLIHAHEMSNKGTSMDMSFLMVSSVHPSMPRARPTKIDPGQRGDVHVDISSPWYCRQSGWGLRSGGDRGDGDGGGLGNGGGGWWRLCGGSGGGVEGQFVVVRLCGASVEGQAAQPGSDDAPAVV